MRKIAILFLLLAGAVFAGVLDTVWRAPKYGNLVRVATLADGRQFLQVLRNDTLTCISTKDGSVVWQFDISDAIGGIYRPRRAGILDFNWDGTADFWKIVPGPEGICTLKVVGLEDSFRVNMMLADEWVLPVAMRSFSGVLTVNLIPYTDSLRVNVVGFDGEVVYSNEFSYAPIVRDVYIVDLLGIKGNFICFTVTGHYDVDCPGYAPGCSSDGEFTIGFNINIVSHETHKHVVGDQWHYDWWDIYGYFDWGSHSWRLLYNNFSTDFTVAVFVHDEHEWGHTDWPYHTEYSSYYESSLLESENRRMPSRPSSPKGKFIPNIAGVDYFFNYSDSLYFGSKFVDLVASEFPRSLLKFEYGLAQDGMIISSEDSIYGVVFNMLFVNRGWNLFSNTFAEPLPISEIFDSYISPAYSWNNEDKIYNLTDILAPGQTAWVFSLDSGFVEIPPIPTADSLTYVLYPGWNLIGAPREGALASRITESPAVLNAVFGFDPQTNTYFVADTLQPFCGYWVFTTDTVNITVP